METHKRNNLTYALQSQLSTTMNVSLTHEHL